MGGLSGLIEKLDPQTLSFFPDPGNGAVFVSLLVVPLATSEWKPETAPQAIDPARTAEAEDRLERLVERIERLEASYARLPEPTPETTDASLAEPE